MAQVSYVDYQNKTILYIDFQGSASDAEVLAIGEKARQLVSLGRRNNLYVLYNLQGVHITRPVMMNLRRLLANAHVVSRRVLFGVPTRFEEVVWQVISMMNLGSRTLYAQSYTQGMNILVDDENWKERRTDVEDEVVSVEVERRNSAPRVYTEDDYLDKLDQLPSEPEKS